ncbi:DNA mismatch repair endonuclease MutL [Shewanella surugensis]|uniref:DNA mismatch repair protein MutL n=1 Tax=Shewanella surugensis TaxID=212020 RepID=A0ABT0LFN8_9GAMM|nr:DNA mismatch repair endonuclease MutL [Shewanella surugensis]MCL1126147.1 DNA mismatch repair endonuclease MutL [Shewanella surugensis]
MSILKLPPQLANQIAAGEVVERPASVIKELVENSLDAGASQVDIEIEKGGSKLIRIRDNGSGIEKADLTLALSRHATSKLSSLDDLDAILSFGFRGEALASISSVSRLTLTSNTLEQNQAWKAQTEGIEMAVKVLPAAHPVGTSIEVVDLFFNTPARRRFLKSDKTEFTHIDEWLKRIVLARKNVHFTLKHNGKMVRNYRSANSQTQYLQRLGQVCGKVFAETALHIDCEHSDLKLNGYLQSPEIHSNHADIQYFYVNGRLIRDRLVNHAVRQAFNELNLTINPSYVLMLTIDPYQVDVNVHPAKHEVRFHQSRYVHDYLLQALQSALIQIHSNAIKADDAGVKAFSTVESAGSSNVPLNSQSQTEAKSHVVEHIIPIAEYKNSQTPIRLREHTASTAENSHIDDAQPASTVGKESMLLSATELEDDLMLEEGTKQSFRQPLFSVQESKRAELPSKAEIASYGALLTTNTSVATLKRSVHSHLTMPVILGGEYWVITKSEDLQLLKISEVAIVVLQNEISRKLTNGLIGQPLLMPVSISADPDWIDTIALRNLLLKKLGIELSIRLGQLIIKKVPPYLRDCQLATLIPELLQWIRFEEPNEIALVAWLTDVNKIKFTAPSDIWLKWTELDDSLQETTIMQAVRLPWQAWLKENTSE